MLDRLVGEHAERRDDVFLEILVLVVAPDQDDVGRERVKLPARFAESRDQRLAMPLCGAQPSSAPYSSRIGAGQPSGRR
jgi:hypothetical protein